MEENLYGLFRQSFPLGQSRRFLETVGGERYTYEQVEEITERYTAALRLREVGKHDRVVCVIGRRPEQIFLYLACLRCGITYVPVNPAYHERELAYAVQDVDAKAVVCDETTLDRMHRLSEVMACPSVLTIEDLNRESARDAAIVSVDADHIGVIIHTSGITGQPKGAMLTHRNLGARALVQKRIWGWGPDDVLLHVMPLFHTHGLCLAMNGVLLSGAQILLLPRFDAADVIKYLPRCTVFSGVPTMYRRLLERPELSESVCSSMRLFISGSAPLPSEISVRFFDRTGRRILQVYGMTETNTLTSNPLRGERRPGSVGFPLPGFELRVVDERGSELPAGDAGELEVRGADLFSGYWRKPEETTAALRSDGFFRTGDVAVIGKDGYVYIVGRSKEMIISGGYKICPKEIEDVISRMEGVKECAVIGVAHPDYQEGCVAVVELEAKSRHLTEEAVISHARQLLASYKIPRRVCFVDELPRTDTGKVIKTLLRQRYGDVFTPAG